MPDPYTPLSLQISDLSVSRGGRLVLEGITFALHSGQAAMLSGPNGAGKSTLIRAILGLVRPASGTVSVTGRDTGGATGAAEWCHYTGHRDAIKTALTVRENILFWQQFLGGGGAGADAALEAMGLAGLAGLPAGYLSAGQRRRLGLARLVAVDRPVWLLDEPTAALDAASEANLVSLMRAHIARNGILLAATHLPIAIDGALHLSLAAPDLTGDDT